MTSGNLSADSVNGRVCRRRGGGRHLLQVTFADSGASSSPLRFQAQTGWPEAVARLRLPQNAACGFPALRSSELDLQHSERLELPIAESQLGTL